MNNDKSNVSISPSQGLAPSEDTCACAREKLVESGDAATTKYTYFKIVDSKVNLREAFASENGIQQQQTALFITNNYSLPINFPQQFKQLVLYSISGSMVGNVRSSSDISTLLNKISAGIYLAKFIGYNNETDVRKLIKQ